MSSASKSTPFSSKSRIPSTGIRFVMQSISGVLPRASRSFGSSRSTALRMSSSFVLLISVQSISSFLISFSSVWMRSCSRQETFKIFCGPSSATAFRPSTPISAKACPLAAAKLFWQPARVCPDCRISGTTPLRADSLLWFQARPTTRPHAPGCRSGRI